ncbi:uncharacterized protein LOC120689723 [Panicum virgatum]|uniref:uncharacterized protein LOC120689723 n=1 Tax=Panicum virgatum TaxID=38727 RepID=UPI0019D6824E|nr:uncharacterized protein LOC120689723 [Panicum virgatum]
MTSSTFQGDSKDILPLMAILFWASLGLWQQASQRRVQLWLMISANCQKEYLVKFQKKKCLSSTKAWLPVIHSLRDSWCQFFNCHIRILLLDLGSHRGRLGPYALGVASSPARRSYR